MIKKVLISIAISVGLMASVAAPALAVTPDDMFSQACSDGGADSSICQSQREQAGPIIKRVVNLLLWAVGIIAVIMLIWGGIRYATSAGDSGKVAAAKNTILYSIVGVIVALLSFAVVDWVDRFL